MHRSPVSGRFVLGDSKWTAYTDHVSTALPLEVVLKSPFPKPSWIQQGDERSVQHHCGRCGKQPLDGQFLLVQTEVVGERVVWFVMHELCLQQMLATAPKETYSAIKARLDAGGPLFDG